jgi:uracil-DNA glycosylase family 4
MSQDLAEHLRYFKELGVTGVSRDPAWRRREVDTRPAPAPLPAPDAAIDDAPSAAAEAVLPTGRHSAAAVGGADVLTLLRAEIGPDCTRCKLHTLGRKQVVFGVGNPDADLMFVGEAPGADEDIQGEPFVGRAGQLLTKIIEAIGLSRDQVYIANVIKCRPPGNRNPELDEVERCEPFLFRQIDAIKPKVIVALGKFAAQSLLKSTDPITRLRGRTFTYRGASLIPTFHPAYLLRNPSSKREVWEDMKKVRAILQGEE